MLIDGPMGSSIGKLFGAAVIPALTQAVFYVAVIWLMCRWKPDLGPAAGAAGAARGGGPCSSWEWTIMCGMRKRRPIWTGG